MVSTLIALTCLSPQDFPKDYRPTVKRWFVFLNSGPKKTPMTSEESAAGMKGHLGNFAEQYKAGNLDLAGPLGDNGFIRGIVAVRATDEKGVRSLFQTDPFVQNKRLVLEMYSMDGPFDRVLHPEGEVGMTSMTLVIVKKGQKWTPRYRMPKSIGEWDRDGKLAFWARFGLKDSDKLGMIYFWDKDLKTVSTWVQNDPDVGSGAFSFQAHPQYIGKMFRER